MNFEEHQKDFVPVGIRTDVQETGPLYHGTKADLQVGDLLKPGFASNFGEREVANYVYLSATLDAAMWGAELAVGEGRERIYLVEPTGPIDDDPNLTDMRFPGNPTKSYRTQSPLRIVGEVEEWEGHSQEAIQTMLDSIEKLNQAGHGAITELESATDSIVPPPHTGFSRLMTDMTPSFVIVVDIMGSYTQVIA